MTTSAAEAANTVRTAIAGLREAIGAAGPRWDDPVLASEDPEDDAWSPRLASLHAVVTERFRVVFVTEIAEARPRDPWPMRGWFERHPWLSDPEGREREFERLATPALMQGALDDMARDFERLFGRLRDEDLLLPVAIMEGQQGYMRYLGVEVELNVGGLLALSAGHLRDHTKQLRGTGRCNPGRDTTRKPPADTGGSFVGLP